MTLMGVLLLVFAASCRKADIKGDTDAENQIRKAGSPKETRLASLRKHYLDLAEILYAPIRGKPIEVDGKIDNERLSLTQLWIDALIQNGREAEALKLALECRRVSDKRRKTRGERIEARYAPRIRACKAAIGQPKVIDKLVKEFEDELKALAKDPEGECFDPKHDAGDANFAQKMMKAVIARGAKAAEIKRLTDDVSRKLVIGYQEIIEQLKRRIPVNPGVEWNVAKCLAATGKYTEAMDIYVRLIQGTNPEGDEHMARVFWRLQLEYCQTFTGAFSKSRKQMAKLVAYIETELPKVGGDSLGGFKSQFTAIKREAQRPSK